MSERKVIANEAVVLCNLVIQAARNSVVFLSEPIIALSPEIARLVGDLLDSNYTEAVRWLCIGNEMSPQNFSIQVTDQALYTSNGFRPVEVELSINEDGAIEIDQQHVRAHTRLVWKEIDGKWCLANKDFAGVEAHQFVTEKYDAMTEEYVVTKSLMSEDEPYFRQCSSVKTLVTLGTYCNGQILT